jgi:ADP-dependent NAD(P)H-hydrate dehydratase / NAD(P)H-hydrate epimerase
MRAAHSVEQIRVAEAELMARLPPGALMARAARGLAVACADFLGHPYGARVVLLVGAGDNGGDALFAGAQLAGRGAHVEAVLLSGDATHPSGLAALLRAGGRVATEPAWETTDLVLDAIVGIGGRPGLRSAAESLVTAAAGHGLPVLAVDLPSGVDVDTGETPSAHVQADVTVTFGTHKVALLVDPAAAAAGAVHRVDIGLGPYLPEPVITSLQGPDVAALLPKPGREAHKYSRGVVGVRAGSDQYSGAGVLCVAGAMCGTAGLVRYLGAAEPFVRADFPEVVPGDGQVQAWVVGSGGGDGSADQVTISLATGTPTVIDADGLRHLPARLSRDVLLTPHAGELARLLDVDRSDVEARPLHHARAASQRWHCVVLLKGAHTVVVAPDGRVRVNTTGPAWLATAGAGDVLSGLCGSLLASGLTAFDAGSVGAWLHGAGAAWASRGGPITARQVAQAVPSVIADLLS